MKTLLVLLLASAAHSKEGKTQLYADPQGAYELQAPKGWVVQGNAETKRPISVVEFIGSEKPQDEGEILGAVLKVVRLSRKENPRSALEPTEKLFARASETRVAGNPARGFEREYDHVKAAFHGGGKIPMKTSGFVVETGDAYYIVEFRAEKKQYDKFKWALERARATFRLL